MWATQFSGTGYIEYSPDGVNYQRRLALSRTYTAAETGLPAAFTQYVGVMPRLSPNTSYFYRAIVNTDVVGATSRFRTAPFGPVSFRFLAIGDSGMGSPEQFRVASLMTQEDAAFVLHVGDIAYLHGSYDEFQKNHFDVYRQILARTPLFPAPGNHEYESASAAPYLALHTLPAETVSVGERGRYYSFDWGNAHFVSLDTNSDRSSGALRRALNGTGDMLSWLDRDLRSTRQFWRIVFFHHAPYAGGLNAGDPVEGDVRRYVVPILEANGVQLVLNGHEHNYQRTYTLKGDNTVADGTGTVYLTTGGGGATLYTLPSNFPQTAVQRISNHFIRSEVSGGQITLTSINDGGIEIDRVTITPQPVFADASRAVTFSGDPVAGALIYARGWNLSMQESALQATPVESLLGTNLTLDGRPVPLIYVSPTQVVGQLPFDLPNTSTCQLRTPNGVASFTI